MGVLCWGVYGCCGCPQASSTCAGRTSMDRGKAKCWAILPSACPKCLSPSHQCGTGPCGHPGAWDCGWALSSSIIFPSRNVGVCDHSREWDPSPRCPQQAVI